MDFSVGQILVEINKNTMWQTLLSGVMGALVGGLATLIASHFTNKKNEQIFKRSYFYEQKMELSSDIIILILSVSSNILEITENQKNKHSIKYHDRYLSDIKNLTEKSYKLHVIADLYFDMKDIAKELQDFYFVCENILKYFYELDNLSKKNEIINVEKDIIFETKYINRKNGNRESIFDERENDFTTILKEFDKRMEHINKILTDKIEESIN